MAYIYIDFCLVSVVTDPAVCL